MGATHQYVGFLDQGFKTRCYFMDWSGLRKVSVDFVSVQHSYKLHGVAFNDLTEAVIPGADAIVFAFCF